MIESTPLAELRQLRFRRQGLRPQVDLARMWQQEGRVVLALAGDAGRALLLPGGAGWMQPFWNEEGALLDLLASLPSEPDPKFIALPSFAFAQVAVRWPRLHRLDHELWELPGEEDPPSCPRLEERDIEAVWAGQPWLAEFGGTDYLRHLIQGGMTAVVRGGGIPIAWALCHDDGSVGSLRVQPDRRRSGLGALLIGSLAARLTKAGLPTIGHISPRNPASVALVGSLGGRRTGFVEAWVRRRTDEEIRSFEAGNF